MLNVKNEHVCKTASPAMSVISIHSLKKHFLSDSGVSNVATASSPTRKQISFIRPLLPRECDCDERCHFLLWYHKV